MITQQEITEILQAPERFRLLRLNPFEDSININGDNIEFKPLILRNDLQDKSTNKKLILLDTETTGLDTNADEIIELAFVVVTYDPLTNVMVSIDNVYDGFNQPTKPISEKIQAITGITNEMVEGKHIDYNSFKAYLPTGKYLIVAHNAGFDRKFVERIYPEIAGKPWADSLTEIDWLSHGCTKSSLEMLMYYQGLFYNAHRAVNDCLALGAVIHFNNALEELLANASRIMYDIEISVSYDNRMFPKNLGFKWRKENTSWVKSYKDLNEWETDREYLNTKNVFYKLISQTENTCLTRFAKVETK